MWYRARIVVGTIGMALAAFVAGTSAATAADPDALVCGSVESASAPQVSCTVTGPEGAEATLVLAITDTAGSEEAAATSKQIDGQSATFIRSMPENAERVLALALVDGTEVASAVVSIPQSSAVDAVVLGVPNFTVAGAAFGTLAIGAVVVYASAHKRGAENRRIGPYRSALT